MRKRPVDAETIRKLIESGLPEARVDVHGDDGVHFEATVISPAFAGKAPLARHRMVYATLGELMGGAIHALQLKTLTPTKAERLSGLGWPGCSSASIASARQAPGDSSHSPDILFRFPEIPWQKS